MGNCHRLNSQNRAMMQHVENQSLLLHGFDQENKISNMLDFGLYPFPVTDGIIDKTALFSVD
jgi:hypothetical protein